MNKEFVKYNQSLTLKELGFNEPCFGFYPKSGGNIQFGSLGKFSSEYTHIISAPLYQQVFRWFREKHNLCGEVYTVNMGAIDYTFQIRDLYSEDVKHDNFEAYAGGYVGTFLTYEEAESACLDKLIEIIKNK